MFTAAIFTTAKIWEQPKCPLTDGWIKKSQYIDTVKYYSALKKEILPFDTTWMDLEGLMLREASQREKNKCRIISFIHKI